MSNPVLVYFDGRGRGESIRMTLVAAGIEWTEKHLKKPEDVDKLKAEGAILFGQTPLLQWHGVNMVQTAPIIRCIAIRNNLFGRPGEEFRVDMLTEGCRDFLQPLMAVGFMPPEQSMNSINQTAPRYMPVYEKILSESKSGYLVGDQMTLADVALFEVLLLLVESIPNGMDAYPKLKAFHQKMKSDPKFAAYLSGPKRHGPATAAYVNEVKTVLRW